VANGTDAYVDAVECCLGTAAYAAKQIEASPHLTIATEPQLLVVLFRREGWDHGQYARWSAQVRTSGLALVTPTAFAGEPVLRFCIVNPLTSTDDIDLIIESLEHNVSDN
jgi:glutamate/tyrosine decarboxylase-like PLP-dependent enzyme